MDKNVRTETHRVKVSNNKLQFMKAHILLGLLYYRGFYILQLFLDIFQLYYQNLCMFSIHLETLGRIIMEELLPSFKLK